MNNNEQINDLAQQLGLHPPIVWEACTLWENIQAQYTSPDFWKPLTRLRILGQKTGRTTVMHLQVVAFLQNSEHIAFLAGVTVDDAHHHATVVEGMTKTLGISYSPENLRVLESRQEVEMSKGSVAPKKSKTFIFVSDNEIDSLADSAASGLNHDTFLEQITKVCVGVEALCKKNPELAYRTVKGKQLQDVYDKLRHFVEDQAKSHSI